MAKAAFDGPPSKDRHEIAIKFEHARNMAIS